MYFRLSIINDDRRILRRKGGREGKNEAIFLITMLLIMYFLSYMPGGTMRWLGMNAISIEQEKKSFLNPQLSTVFIILAEKKSVVDSK